jgi:hypothetical protein|tara:strand:- start:7848 stop:8264 length:417 start_codon:yes stop_codon:yes gene_type:complete
MKGIIYKIVDNTNNDVYYGGTYQSLSARKSGHKRDYNRYKNGKSFYTTAYDIFDRGDFNFEKIDSIENDDLDTLKYELKLLERNYIENNTCVNKVIPGRTKAEYQRYYYNQNKDRINKQRKERRLHKKIISNINIDNV